MTVPFWTTFDRYTVLNLHGLLSDNLLQDPGAAAGCAPLRWASGKPCFTRWKAAAH
ncbi:MAG: hypothetical protein IPH54_10905 [Rhodoferax sp.]|nr:hypothetical protein [Rhodoferax sp.]